MKQDYDNFDVNLRKVFIMDPSFVSFDSSALNELSSRTAHYSQADISKALAILGFGSWASIEPSK